MSNSIPIVHDLLLLFTFLDSIFSSFFGCWLSCVVKVAVYYPNIWRFVGVFVTNAVP